MYCLCMYVCLSPEVALFAISHPFCQCAGRSAITTHQHDQGFMTCILRLEVLVQQRLHVQSWSEGTY